MTEVETGRVRTFWPENGYGFIARHNSPSVFMHAREIPLGWIPQKDNWVTYQLVYDNLDRPQAINVLPVEDLE